MSQASSGVWFRRVDSVTGTETGVLARLHGELLGIDVVRADLVRLRISRGGAFDESPTAALCVDPLADPAAFEVERADGVVRVRTAALVVSLGLDPFRLDVHRADGSPVLASGTDGHGGWGTYGTLNDAFWLVRSRRPADVFHGLGEKSGPYDRSGREFTLWNTDVLDPRASGEVARRFPDGDPRTDEAGTLFDPYYMSIPLLYHQDAESGAMAGSFVDNGYRGHYDLSAARAYRIGFDGGQYTEYVFAGPGMPEILSAYTWLTGRMAVPPVWALGYHQCRWHPYTEAEVEALGRRLREGGVPCDALWLDIDHMDGYRVFTWDTARFPDPAAMLANLATQGFRVVTIVDPGVKFDPGYRVFDEAMERDLLCRTEGGGIYLGQVWPGLTAFPDFASAEARAWWGALNAEHVRSGLAGIWNDMNEPATGEIAPEAMRFDHGRVPHERVHNQYALLMAMGTVEGLRAVLPELRTFVLSRAGSAGIQRYAANWMGDNQSRWDHLAMSIAMGNGLGVSGQPFVGADIGGFMGQCDAELLVRWTQYGALTPFCRNHSAAWTPEQYPWSFGPEVEALVAQALRLRYRLMPYLYTCFVRAAETGAPVQRPLVFDHQGDPALRTVEDEFLLGPDLLVAPVTAPGVTERPVVLPAGDWYDWFDDAVIAGGRTVVAAAPPDRIPILARSGAVVAMWPEAPASADGHHPQVVELHLFVPRADGRHASALQEDDGRTLAAVEGASRFRTSFDVARAGGLVTLVGSVEGRGYPEFARSAFRLVIHGARPRVVRHDGVERAVVGGAVLLAERRHRPARGVRGLTCRLVRVGRRQVGRRRFGWVRAGSGPGCSRSMSTARCSQAGTSSRPRRSMRCASRARRASRWWWRRRDRHGPSCRSSSGSDSSAAPVGADIPSSPRTERSWGSTPARAASLCWISGRCPSRQPGRCWRRRRRGWRSTGTPVIGGSWPRLTSSCASRRASSGSIPSWSTSWRRTWVRTSSCSWLRPRIRTRWVAWSRLRGSPRHRPRPPTSR